MKSKHIAFSLTIVAVTTVGTWWICTSSSQEVSSLPIPTGTASTASLVVPASPVVATSGSTTAKSLVFTTPDTSWKTRTIVRNGKPVTYVFGEGNPSEVALTGQALEEYRNGPLESEYPGYVTPEVEKALKAFIESEDLPFIMNRCKAQLGYAESGFPDLSMESLLYVDETTGRKELNGQLYLAVHKAILWLDFPLADDNDKRWHECLAPVDHSRLQALRESFANPGRQFSNMAYQNGKVDQHKQEMFYPEIAE